MNINLPTGITIASVRELDRLADITAEAFSEDPVNMWIFGSPRALKPAFRILAKANYLKHGFCHLFEDAGATMWIDSERMHPPSKLSMLKFSWILQRHASKGAMARAMAFDKAMTAHHPKSSHLYLFTIGTRKSARGSGVGKGLLRPVLEAADREGRACYLENTNPDNTGFYGAHGFKRIDVFDAGRDSPPMEAMWRDPRP